MLLFGLAYWAGITRLFKNEFALGATRLGTGLQGPSMGEQLDLRLKSLLQTHGLDVAREGETPACQLVLIVLKAEASHPGVVVMAHGQARGNGPTLPLPLPLGLGEQDTLVCHNQEPGRKMQIRVEVNLEAGQRVFLVRELCQYLRSPVGRQIQQGLS